jgi:hypothetical protein
MNDGDLRGIILERFYELRNQPGMVNVPELPEIVSLEPNVIRRVNICQQLEQCGLIQWESANSLNTVGGWGRIAASGVDVIEGRDTAPITVNLNDHRISVSQSSNVQIGDSNTIRQSLGIQPHDLTRLVTELTEHLDELNLDGRERQRAEVQIAALKVELAGDPDPAMLRQTGRSLRSITEGAIGSLLATAATNPAV